MRLLLHVHLAGFSTSFSGSRRSSFLLCLPSSPLSLPKFPISPYGFTVSLLFRLFLHRCIIRHIPTGCTSAFNLLYSLLVSRQSCITSVVPSSLPHPGARTPFSFLDRCFPVCFPKLGFPLANDGSFVYFCLSTFQTGSRECFHSFHLGSVTPSELTLKPEERPQKLGLSLEARDFGDLNG